MKIVAKQKKLAVFGSHSSSHFRMFKAAGYIQKHRNWVAYELKLRDAERRFCMSEMLFRIVTGDEKLSITLTIIH